MWKQQFSNFIYKSAYEISELPSYGYFFFDGYLCGFFFGLMLLFHEIWQICMQQTKNSTTRNTKYQNSHTAWRICFAVRLLSKTDTFEPFSDDKSSDGKVAGKCVQHTLILHHSIYGILTVSLCHLLKQFQFHHSIAWIAVNYARITCIMIDTFIRLPMFNVHSMYIHLETLHSIVMP